MKKGAIAIFLVVLIIGIVGAVIIYSGTSSPSAAASVPPGQSKICCKVENNGVIQFVLIPQKACENSPNGEEVAATNCVLSKSCGNDKVNGAEQCDGADDNACGVYPCKADCTCQFCGDGATNGPEQCDNAPCANNYNCVAGTCNCELCGDAIKNGNEECDGADDVDCAGNCQGDCSCPGGGGGGDETCADLGGQCAVLGEQSCVINGGVVLHPTTPCAGIGEICCRPQICGDGVTQGTEQCDPSGSDCDGGGICGEDCMCPQEPTPTATPTEPKDPCPTNDCLLPEECNGFKQVGTVCDPLICCIPADTPIPTPNVQCQQNGGQCAVTSVQSCQLNGGTVLAFPCPNVGEICCKPGATPTPTPVPCLHAGESCDPDAIPDQCCSNEGICQTIFGGGGVCGS